jgi:hypothetical protein
MIHFNSPRIIISLLPYGRLRCNECGVDASCNCGAPVVPAFKRAEDAIKANPNRSNRAIAEEAGVSEWSVRDAKKNQGARDHAPDERPTIDNPPKGAPWDDQNDNSQTKRPPEGGLSQVCAGLS